MDVEPDFLTVIAAICSVASVSILDIQLVLFESTIDKKFHSQQSKTHTIQEASNMASLS